MSSHDPVCIDESAGDRALREELSQLLGAPAPNFFHAEPSPEMIALAEDLRREAARRRRTTRQRPSWMLLAAALPLALAFTGMATWGIQQKRRADAMAVVVVEKEQALQRAAVEVREQRQALQLAASIQDKGSAKGKPGVTPRPGELVIPVDAATPGQSDVRVVKDR